MDARTGRGGGFDRNKGKDVTRTSRPEFTQPSRYKGLVVEDGKIRVPLMLPKKHSKSMEIGASLMRFIKGKGGGTQKKIEEETGVKIIFPSSSEEDSIIIEGYSAESIAKALTKIQAIIDKAVNSRVVGYTHFISLPLAIDPGLVNNKLVNFQKTILGIAGSDQDNKDLGITKSIFIKPETFHLTVLMLKLWTKERVKAAVEVLQGVSSKVMDALENRPVSIRLKGLACWGVPPAMARVIYAPVEEIGGEGRLLRACKAITDAFIEAGLVIENDAQKELTLHATLMTARHRKREERTRKVYSIDARGIFEKHGSEEWGEYPIREAHLSKSSMDDQTGYYHRCASIRFPENKQLLSLLGTIKKIYRGFLAMIVVFLYVCVCVHLCTSIYDVIF